MPEAAVVAEGRQSCVRRGLYPFFGVEGVLEWMVVIGFVVVVEEERMRMGLGHL